jgi:hypothetical protein
MKMRRFHKVSLVLVLLGGLLFTRPQDLSAWSVPTHVLISGRAAEDSNLNTGLLPQFGFLNLSSRISGEGAYLVTVNQSIENWIQYGAQYEDGNIFQIIRPRNHFHNPICQAPWTSCQPPWPDAGLHDSYLGLPISGESALLWAQDPANNNWAWQGVRQAYSDALTATTDTDREHRFAQTFRGIGHVIHLIQDMGVPAHVRNDQHLAEGLGLAGGLESWASSQEAANVIAQFLGQSPVIPPLPQGPGLANLAPITQFWDTDRYDGTTATLSVVNDPNIGLAEYTNANYFSDDTIAAPVGSRHHFDFPSTDINDYSAYTDDAPAGSQGQKRWYLYRAGSASAHTFAGSFLRSPNEPQPSAITSNLVLDAKVHEDYSRDLIPRAVGYSVGLINYFFWGQIALSLPNRGVYALSDGNSGFTECRITRG